MLFALDICVNKKAPPTHSVHWGVKPTSETLTPSFLTSHLLILQTIQTPASPPVSGISPQYISFHATP